ncbi:MAG: DUF4838 domain-containing protein [Clostridia bacterium]|nr:DUF4838 domain-containing protein [Clostridia bacterium]
MKILLLRNSETLKYAAEELLKYLKMMDAGIDAEICENAAEGENTVSLGLLSDLSLYSGDLNDAMIDDVIDVNIDCLNGYLAGSNERSVLMGVYNYLKSAGCRWVRPGEKGEYIPKADMKNHSFRFRKKADFPFRGECIEGAVSFEHVRDTVLWLPKANMNMFMIEQIVPYNYMNRWYRHLVNTKMPHEDIPYEQYCEYCLELEHLIKKLGLQLHVMGHGALNEPFGIRHMVSGMQYNVPDDVKQAFALVKGKRELYGNSPFFTQLCMSKEWVQDKIVNWLADYLDQKPYIDFLHFWLADNTGNQCECEDCVKVHPSDCYVQMLNKLDKILTERGNPAKIVFIMYTDTMWAPEKEKLNNPARFILTTATTRAKGDKYSDKRSEKGIPQWMRNKINIPHGFDTTLSFLDGWKPIFDGPKFIYEYYMYTAHFADPGYMQFSRNIATDMKGLHLTGFDGVMSDQTQRSFFPTGLPMTIIGEFQFDTSIDTEQFIDKYLKDSFGDGYSIAKEYLEAVSDVFDLNTLSQNSSIVNQDTGAADSNSTAAGIIGNKERGRIISTVPNIVEKYLPVFQENAELCDPCHRESYKILIYHCEYCKYLSKIYCALADSDKDLAKKYFAQAIDYLSEIECDIHPYFDLVLFYQNMKQTIER